MAAVTMTRFFVVIYGYYDRYLADYDGHTVSTIYEFQKVEFQADCHDMAVKEVFSR